VRDFLAAKLDELLRLPPVLSLLPFLAAWQISKASMEAVLVFLAQ